MRQIEGSERGGRVDEYVASAGVKEHMQKCTRAGGKQAKKGRNLNWKFEVFTSSDQKSDDTSPPKHGLCDFETSLRIQIRHDSDYE